MLVYDGHVLSLSQPTQGVGGASLNACLWWLCLVFVSANPSGRWSFIQGSWTGPGSGSSGKSKSRKLYSRSMQKRILHHKQRLHDIEAAKSMIEKAKDKVS